MSKLIIIIALFALPAGSTTHTEEAAPQWEDYALFVTIKIKPGRIVEFKRLLPAYLEGVGTEKGIWTYKIHQSPEDSTLFEYYMHFSSKESHQSHLAQPHTKHYLGNATPLFEEGYPVRKKVFEIR